MKKKICSILSIMLVFCFVLTACSNTKANVKEINSTIKALQADVGSVTQESLNEAIDKYDALPDNKKKEITNASVLEKYRDIDLAQLQDLQNEILGISDSTSFSDLLSIKEKYDSAESKYQDLVDSSLLEKKLELNNLEKATVVACQTVKKALKSSESFKLISANGVDDANGTSKYYLINIKYSATNSFGATIDDSSFQTINKDFKNPWYGLSALTGHTKEALNNTSFMEFYYAKEPVEMDPEKIMYYINKTNY